LKNSWVSSENLRMQHRFVTELATPQRGGARSWRKTMRLA